jgi:hypothetical protein
MSRGTQSANKRMHSRDTKPHKNTTDTYTNKGKENKKENKRDDVKDKNTNKVNDMKRKFKRFSSTTETLNRIWEELIQINKLGDSIWWRVAIAILIQLNATHREPILTKA